MSLHLPPRRTGCTGADLEDIGSLRMQCHGWVKGDESLALAASRERGGGENAAIDIRLADLN